MATISTVAVKLDMKSAAFTKGVNRANASMKGMGRTVGVLRTNFVRLGGAMLAVVGVGALGAFVRKQAETLDAIAKTSDKLGIATEKLMAYQHAAKLSGVATNTFNMALQRMVRRISEASRGTGEAKNALLELGLNAQKLAALSVDKQFSAIADAMNKTASQSDPVRLAFKLFDSEGVALVNMLKLGSAGLLKYESALRRLGGTMSRALLRRVEEANNALTNMRASFGILAQNIVVKLSPVIEKLAKFITRLSGQILNMNKATKLAIVRAVKWTAAIGIGLIIGPKLVRLTIAIAGGFKAIATGQALAQAFAGPAGWASIAVSLGVAATAAATINSVFSDVANTAQRMARSVEVADSSFTKITRTMRNTSVEAEILREKYGVLETLSRNAATADQGLFAALSLTKDILFGTTSNANDAASAFNSLATAADNADTAIAGFNLFAGEQEIIEDAVKRRKLLERTVERKIEQLRTQVQNLGKTPGQILLGQAERLGREGDVAPLLRQLKVFEDTQKRVAEGVVLDAQAAAFALAERNKALRKTQSIQEALERSGAQIFQATRRPLERYAQQLQHIRDILHAGEISTDTYFYCPIKTGVL